MTAFGYFPDPNQPTPVAGGPGPIPQPAVIAPPIAPAEPAAQPARRVPVMVPPAAAQPQQGAQPAQPVSARFSGPTRDLTGYEREIGAVGRLAQANARQYANELGEAVSDQEQAQRELAAIEGAKAAQEAEVIRQRNAQLEVLQREQQEKEVARQKAQQGAIEDLTQAREATRYNIPTSMVERYQRVADDPTAPESKRKAAKLQLEKAQQVDPDRVLGGAGRKIGAGIAMALGAYGSALTGGPNTAMQIIQASIDRDIDAQKEGFRQNAERAGQASGIYREMLQRFGDERAAEAAARAAMFDAAARKIELVGIASKSPEATARGEGMIAKLRAEGATQAQKAIESGTDARLRASTAAANVAGQRISLAASREKENDNTPKLEGYRFTGKTAPTQVTLTKAQNVQGVKIGAVAAIDKALKLREDNGVEWFGANKAEAATLQHDLMVAAGEVGSAGVLSPEEVKRFKDLVGNPVDIGYQTTKLKAFREMMVRRADAAARAAGFVPEDQAVKSVMRPE